jgi:hypothetical protein
VDGGLRAASPAPAPKPEPSPSRHWKDSENQEKKKLIDVCAAEVERYKAEYAEAKARLAEKQERIRVLHEAPPHRRPRDGCLTPAGLGRWIRSTWS